MKSTQLKPKFSRMIAMQRDFEEIEKFFRSLKRDDLTETKNDDGKWLITQNNLEGTTYDALSSIEDWCNFFKALADMYMPKELCLYNDKPIRKLISKLRLDQPVTMDLVNEAELILKPQRYLFMSVPSHVFNATRAKIFEEQERNVAA